MPWLIVFSVLSFLLLLLFMPLHVSFSYDGGIKASIRYLFIKIPLYPRKPKKTKGTRKKRKKSAVAAKKPKKKAKKAMPSLRFSDIRMLLRLAFHFLKEVERKANGRLKFRIKRLDIVLGGAKDAAVAAIQYGLIAQTAAYLLEAATETRYFKASRRDIRNISVDFLSDTNVFRLQCSAACPLIHTLSLAVFALLRGTRIYNTFKRHRLRGTAKKQNSGQEKESFHG